MMEPLTNNTLTLHYVVEDNNFTAAGEASSNVKKIYEGEINMVIHANGGVIDVEITPEEITMVLRDTGPGIPDVERAMQEGYSTAPDSVRSLGFGAGMGLPNIKKYTDSMRIDTIVGVGTTLTMTVKIKK